MLLLFGLLPILGGCQGCSTAPEPSPATPSDLTATAVSPNQINLTWKDNSNNEKGFYVYRKTTDNYKRVGMVTVNVTSYSNTGLTEGITYHYQVTAYHDDGESERSNEASATTSFSVEILDYHMEEEYYGYDWLEYTTTIVGNVRNNTKDILTIWIAGKFIDQNDIVVEISYDLLEDVKSNETWRFEIVYWNEIGERIKRVEAWVDDYY